MRSGDSARRRPGWTWQASGCVWPMAGKWPERRDNEHLGFFTGIHYCFGAPLARLEVQIAVSEFVRRVENPRLAEDPPPYRRNQIFRGPRRLLVDIDGIRD